MCWPQLEEAAHIDDEWHEHEVPVGDGPKVVWFGIVDLSASCQVDRQWVIGCGGQTQCELATWW